MWGGRRETKEDGRKKESGEMREMGSGQVRREKQKKSKEK